MRALTKAWNADTEAHSDRLNGSTRWLVYAASWVALLLAYIFGNVSLHGFLQERYSPTIANALLSGELLGLGLLGLFLSRPSRS